MHVYTGLHACPGLICELFSNRIVWDGRPAQLHTHIASVHGGMELDETEA